MANTIFQNIHTKEDAVNLANEISRLEAIVKSMKDELKKHVEAYGPVDTGTETWNFYESVSWKFDDLRKVAEGIVLEGKNPWEMLSLSATNLKKLGWDEAVLSQFGKKRVTQRFTSRKK